MRTRDTDDPEISDSGTRETGPNLVRDQESQDCQLGPNLIGGRGHFPPLKPDTPRPGTPDRTEPSYRVPDRARTHELAEASSPCDEMRHWAEMTTTPDSTKNIGAEHWGTPSPGADHQPRRPSSTQRTERGPSRLRRAPDVRHARRTDHQALARGQSRGPCEMREST